MTESQAFFTVREFAKLIKVHPNTVKNSIKSGKILAFKVGIGKRSSYRIAGTEVERMILVDLTIESKKRLGIVDNQWLRYSNSNKGIKMFYYETEARAHQVAQGNYGLKLNQYTIERSGNKYVIRRR